MEKEKTCRYYNIDAIRIIAMFMIVLSHLLAHGGIYDTVLNKGDRSCYYTAYFMKVLCLWPVNVYAICSGFAGYTSKHKLSRVILLLFEVLLL